MRIVFMGTPDFAVGTLKKLVEAGCDIVGVVTAPDRPSGRGQKLRPSPVKAYALEQGLKVLQPPKLKNPEWLEEFQALKPDLAVVVAFRMLPSVVWSVPAIGTFNLHASLLPDYRGAAPINWVLINGEKETGVTTFFIDKKIDTGDLLFQERVLIPEKWTAGDLHDELMQVGAKLVLKTVRKIEAGEAEARPQDHEAYQNPAPKIFKEDCRIEWAQPTDKLYNFIRGLSPYPGAWTTLNDKTFKVFFATKEEGNPGLPGSVKTDGKSFLKIATADGWLNVTQLQIEGKRRMSTEDFLRGFKEEISNVK